MKARKRSKRDQREAREQVRNKCPGCGRKSDIISTHIKRDGFFVAIWKCNTNTTDPTKCRVRTFEEEPEL